MGQEPTIVGRGGCFRPSAGFAAAAILILVGSFLYVWLRIEPHLEYYTSGPYFYRRWAFFATFLHRPGGLAEYAGVFLAQLNCISLMGALVFGLSECMLLLTSLLCLARITGRAPGFVSLIPLLVLLLLRNRYGCPVPAISVGLLLALGFATAHVWWPWRNAWVSTTVAGLISGFLFWIAGLWSALLFALLCGLFVCLQMRNWRAGVSCFFMATLLPLLLLTAGNLEFATLLNPWSQKVNWILVAALYASLPAGVATLVFLPKSGTTAVRPGIASHPLWLEQMLVVLFVLAGVALGLTFDQRAKLMAEIDYSASCGQYAEVLAAARRAKALNHPAKVRLQLALYHTGRLAEDLFSLCDMIDESASEGISDEDCRAQSQPLFELGLLNDAEHMACEALVMQGDRPDLLRLLARINLLKGQPEAAQIFLNVLSLIPFQGQRANLAWPAVGPQISPSEREYLARIGARVLTNDVLHDGLPAGRLMEVLLAANPTNQMAFEYVMADCLLDLDLKRAVEHLRLLDNFKYPRIPRTYEEALLLFQQIAQVQVDLKGRSIRPETAQRFLEFKDAVARFKGTPEDLAAMAANFGDTYWYYFYAVRSRERAAQAQASAPL